MIYTLWKREQGESALRSNRPEMCCKKGVLKNFAKFTEKQLCQSPFFNKVAGLRPGTLLKKRLWYRCFFGEFCEIFKSPYFYRTPMVAASVLYLTTCV